MELPPRARRIPPHFPHLTTNPGTTSACAENTLMAPMEGGRIWNYLRVRGEYVKSFISSLSTPELPPRARRIRPKHRQVCMQKGTTSACAENTRSPPPPMPALAELPPRARRIRIVGVECDMEHGTTSACAENTAAGLNGRGRARNYLRVRGEYRYNHGPVNAQTELPPRARRIPLQPRPRKRTNGTTSACAENTP